MTFKDSLLSSDFCSNNFSFFGGANENAIYLDQAIPLETGNYLIRITLIFQFTTVLQQFILCFPLQRKTWQQLIQDALKRKEQNSEREEVVWPL